MNGKWRLSISWSRVMPMLIVVAALASYANSFSGSFVFDDNYLIVEKAEDFEGLAPVFRQRWLVKWTFKLNYLAGGLQETGYHAVNLAVHLACALLLYAIIRRTFSIMYGDGEESITIFSGLTAMLWAVHPLNTESVTYICQRYESMMAMFALLTLYLFIRGVQSRRAKLWLFASVAACLAGMGTKEAMVVVPVLVLAYDYIFISRVFGRLLRTRWIYYSGLVATLPALTSSELRFVRQVVSGGGGGGGVGEVVRLVSPLPVWRYLLTQSEVILHYLKISFVPYPLCLDYAWQAVDGIGDVWVSFILVAVLFLLGLTLVVLRKPSGYPIFWFFAILAPSSSVIPLGDIAAEHRMYLSLAAVIVMVSGFVYRSFLAHEGSARGRACIVACVVLLVFALGLRTHQRNKVYYSELRMWRNVIQISQENLRARNTLASILLKSGRKSEALSHLDFVLSRTSDVKPVTQLYSPETKFGALPSNSKRHNRVVALTNLGVYFERRDRPEIAAKYYVKALRLFPYKRETLSAYRGLMDRRGLDPEQYERRLAREVWFFDE